jgi:uncharacterized integral membrane protein
VYAAYIATQVDRQEERKKSLESRGVTVITTSGALATLLLGLTAIAMKAASTFELPKDARLPLAVALGAFVLAAILAIFTNFPRNYEEARLVGLRKLIDESWADTEADALAKVAKNQLKVLERAKSIHAEKAWALVLAIAAEAVAVFALLWAMLAILY